MVCPLKVTGSRPGHPGSPIRMERSFIDMDCWARRRLSLCKRKSRAPNSYGGVAPEGEANSERVHGAAGEDPWVAPAFSGGVGAARGSTDNQAQIAYVVPPSSRQLLITDLGLESDAMRFAILCPLLNFIGWPENEDLVFVCRNCDDWFYFMADLRWKCLVRKLFRWISKR